MHKPSDPLWGCYHIMAELTYLVIGCLSTWTITLDCGFYHPILGTFHIGFFSQLTRALELLAESPPCLKMTLF